MEEDRKLAMQLLDLFLKNTEKTKGKTLSLIVDEVRGLSVVVSNNRGKELVTMWPMDDVSPTTIGFEKASRLLEDLAPAHILTMRTISEWVKEEKTPISQAEVIKRTVNKHDIAAASVISALKVLLKKGYIRRAVITSNKTYYVQLRSLR